ncbi:hypothetical protein MBLNU230_g2022t1 [Neophaeotheca triangularis]
MAGRLTEVSHGGSPLQKGHYINGKDGGGSSQGAMMVGNGSSTSPSSPSTATGEQQNDEDESTEEGDSSKFGNQDGSVDKPDAHALPGAPMNGAQAASSRLAGQLHGFGEGASSGSLTPTVLSTQKGIADTTLADSPLSDVSMEEVDQAIEGASKVSEEDGDEDDAYEGLDSMSDSGNSQMDEQELEQSAEKELAKMYERREARRVAKALFKEDEDAMPTSQVSEGANATETAVEDEDDAELDYTEDPFGGIDANTAMEMFPYDKHEDPLGLGQGLGMAEFSFEDQLDDWRRDDFDQERRESQQSAGMPKRVRFEDDVFSRSSSFSNNSDDDEEQDPNDAFPDLFMSQDDPLMQQRLAMVDQEDAAADREFNADNNSDAGSYWDFDDEDKMAFEMDQESESDDSSSSSNDDDSEDGGDTTDEETEESQQMSIAVAIANSKRSPTRGAKSAPGTPAGSRRAINRPTRSSSTGRVGNPRIGKPPPVGTFVVDSRRARMYSKFNNGRSGLIIEPPSRPAHKDKALWDRHQSVMSSRNNSPRNSMSYDGSTPSLDDIPARPFTAHSTLGTMFNGNLDILRNNDRIGITDEAFSAPVTRQNSLAPADYASETEDESEEELNLADFMHYSDSESEAGDDEPQSATTLASPTAFTPSDAPIYSDVMNSPALASSPASRPASMAPSNTDLLSHLDRNRGIVGSFRRNQHRAKQIGSLASHPSLRASTSELNALQKGRRGAANMPMTPARKKRPSADLTPRGSGSGAGIRKPNAAAGAAGSPLAKQAPRRRGGSLGANFSPAPKQNNASK